MIHNCVLVLSFAIPPQPALKYSEQYGLSRKAWIRFGHVSQSHICVLSLMHARPTAVSSIWNVRHQEKRSIWRMPDLTSLHASAEAWRSTCLKVDVSANPMVTCKTQNSIGMRLLERFNFSKTKERKIAHRIWMTYITKVRLHRCCEEWSRKLNSACCC